MFQIALLIAALVCFLLGASNVPTSRVNLVPLGLALATAALLVPLISGA
jgi:hypothetical protein